MIPATPIIDEVERIVPAEWTKAFDIWKLLGCWSHQCVRTALRDLAAAGRIERRVDPLPPGTVNLYRRKP